MPISTVAQFVSREDQENCIAFEIAHRQGRRICGLGPRRDFLCLPSALDGWFGHAGRAVNVEDFPSWIGEKPFKGVGGLVKACMNIYPVRRGLFK